MFPKGSALGRLTDGIDLDDIARREASALWNHSDDEARAVIDILRGPLTGDPQYSREKRIVRLKCFWFALLPEEIVKRCGQESMRIAFQLQREWIGRIEARQHYVPMRPVSGGH